MSSKNINQLNSDLNFWLLFLKKKLGLIQYVNSWHNSMREGANPIMDEIPWITFEAKKWLDTIIKKEMTVFEWGSGGSTLYFSKNVKKVISIEHDAKWYDTVSKKLTAEKRNNVEYILKEPEVIISELRNVQDPNGYFSNGYNNLMFKEYVRVIDSFPDETFDLVVVDGRSRPACINHSVNKVRVGGYLMLDDSDREYYKLGMNLLSDWQNITFFGPGPYLKMLWGTSVWKKINKTT